MKFSDSVDETLQAANIAEHFQADHQIINLDNFLIELPNHALYTIMLSSIKFWIKLC